MRTETPAPDLGGCGLCWAELCADQRGDARRPSARAPRPQEASGHCAGRFRPGPQLGTWRLPSGGLSGPPCRIGGRFVREGQHRGTRGFRELRGFRAARHSAHVATWHTRPGWSVSWSPDEPPACLRPAAEFPRAQREAPAPHPHPRRGRSLLRGAGPLITLGGPFRWQRHVILAN